jgi:hypothetical protein
VRLSPGGKPSPRWLAILAQVGDIRLARVETRGTEEMVGEAYIRAEGSVADPQAEFPAEEAVVGTAAERTESILCQGRDRAVLFCRVRALLHLRINPVKQNPKRSDHDENEVASLWTD